MARERQSLLERDRIARLNLRRQRAQRSQERRVQERRAERRVRVDAIAQARVLRSSLPTYELDITRVDGNIHTLTARAVTNGRDNFSIPLAQRAVAVFLRTAIRGAIGEATGWTPRQIQRNVSGQLQVTNRLSTAAAQAYTIGSIEEITQDKIDEIFTNIQQSETEVEFQNIDFMFIVDPASYRVGAGVVTKRGKGLAWENFSDAEGPINCAAIALTILTHKHRFDQKKPLLKKYILVN